MHRLVQVIVSESQSSNPTEHCFTYIQEEEAPTPPQSQQVGPRTVHDVCVSELNLLDSDYSLGEHIFFAWVASDIVRQSLQPDVDLRT